MLFSVLVRDIIIAMSFNSFGKSSFGGSGGGSGSSWGNGAAGGSGWPKKKIPSQSFAAKRGDYSAGGAKKAVSKFGPGSKYGAGKFGAGKFSKTDARKNAIDSMSWDLEKSRSEKIKKEETEKQKAYWKSIKLSPESEDVINSLENTSENLFITGRAGTGKSTLLGYFREHTKKNVVVVAPTGVAALNVRGQTVHSFFKFKPGVTEHDVKKITAEIDQKMYQKIDMLIVDEISMVRADLFDCIDRFMRLNGKDNTKPFGGVQIVVIGDLFQLPPVVGPGEQYIFETKYESPYFFDSKAYKAGDFQVIELTHVYRQNDPVFIDILDRIRTGEAEMQHVEYINRICLEKKNPDGSTYKEDSRVVVSESLTDPVYVDDEGVPVDSDDADGASGHGGTGNGGRIGGSSVSKQAPSPEAAKKNSVLDDLKKQFGGMGLKTGGDLAKANSGKDVFDLAADLLDAQGKKKLTVYLVTTNALADSINIKKLEELKGIQKTYKGDLVGRFDQKNAPAPAELTLKVGAQVMTLKNDPSGKWVNGDIGTVEKMLDNSVRVKFEDGRVEEVVGDSWEMVKYEYDELSDHLESEVIGKYTQIPIKLAWAVTIHKSQGKTFDTAIIDFGKGTFAHGQAYVALSRVRSLEGITLKNPLKPQDVRIDERIRDFMSGAR